MSFVRKNTKRQREKWGKCKRKRKKGEENEKRGSKRVKLLQNREELRQKGHNGIKKTKCCERGKNIIFRRGGE
jgi:hypothetical protein